MGYEIFDNEERILINQICKNENLSKLSRKNVLDSLIFSQQTANDTMVSDLVDGLRSKMEVMKDEVWETLKLLTPFPTVNAGEELPE